MDYKRLGKRIKDERIKRKLSQEKLAELVGLSSDHISHIENASTKMSLESLITICNALQVTPDLVLYDSIYQSREYLNDDIAILLKDMAEEDLRLIIRLIKAVADK